MTELGFKWVPYFSDEDFIEIPTITFLPSFFFWISDPYLHCSCFSISTCFVFHFLAGQMTNSVVILH